MLTHLFLPALREGKSPKVPEVSGKWDSNEQRILGTIAEGIAVDEHAVARGVTSIPDVWARPLMFASALRSDSGHPLRLRERLVSEWRGLLSLIALSRVNEYDLELVYVPLGSGPFANALRQLAPRPVRLEGERAYDWTDVVIIRYQGIPVGGLSPLTLVYTGTDYARRLADRALNLKDGDGFLAPPRDDKERAEKLALAEWVVSLQGRFRHLLDADINNPSRAAVGVINGLLGDWERDLRQVLGLHERDDVDSPDVRIDEDTLPVVGGESLLTDHRIYRELLRPLESLDRDRRSTELELRGSRRGISRYSTIVVVTRNLIARNALIWGQKRLNRLGGDVEQVLARHFNADSGTVIDKEDIGRREALWIRPERYFLSDALIKAGRGSKFIAADEAAFNWDARFLPPFKPEILHFFSPTDLQTLSTEFTRESEQSITFRFKLPVGDTSEWVEKVYRYKNPADGQGSIVEVEAPLVELFPRYLDSSWRRYYLFQQGTADLLASPVVNGANATTATREHTDSKGTKLLVTTSVAEAVRDDEGATLRTPSPEAIAFSMTGKGVVGLVLLARPLRHEARSGEWRIGIDFGTSNTNVFRQSSRESEAARWEFRFAEDIQPITAAAVARRSEFLLPHGNIPLPIPTHLRIHREPLRQHVLLDYFMDLSGSYHVPDQVYTNIKWQDKDRKTEFFLESLLLMVFVDAARHRIEKVTFACSYPKAFSHNAISTFKGEWAKVMRRILEGPERLLDTATRGGSYGVHLQHGPDVFEVEGVAAGEFFASDKTIPNISDRAKKANAAVCLDVGGGTTDISLWFDNAIVADASVKLAGRQVSEMLGRHFKILELLLPAEAVGALEERRRSPEQFAASLNIALRRDDRHIRDMLIRHSNAREVQALKRLLVSEFGAIAFYAAEMVAAYDRKAAGGLTAMLSHSGIGMHWGGNAAKFLNWIDFGRFDKAGIGPMILNAVVYHALQDAEVKVAGKSIEQHQSPGHKDEAAGGLAVMEFDERSLGAGEHADFEMDIGSAGTVCGEDIELTSGTVDHLRGLGEADLFVGKKTTFVKTSLNRLRRFVEIINRFGIQRGVFTSDSSIVLSDDRRGQIADLVRGEFVKAASKKEGDREIEPVFIMEVKFLLELLKEELGR